MTKGEVYNTSFFQRAFSIGSCLALLSLMFFLAPAAGRADVGPSNAEVTAGVQSRLYHAGIFKHGQVHVHINNGIATQKIGQYIANPAYHPKLLPNTAANP